VLFRSALNNENITVYGKGLQTRSFCYVTDLIEGLFKLFFTESIHSPVNLGNPMPVTIYQLAREIIEYTNSNSKIVFEELPSDDPKDRCPDISKAMQLLNWSPLINRETGLKETIKSIKNN
jgi:dTDP-glucose 4,6-dehydratase